MNKEFVSLMRASHRMYSNSAFGSTYKNIPPTLAEWPHRSPTLYASPPPPPLHDPQAVPTHVYIIGRRLPSKCKTHIPPFSEVIDKIFHIR